MPRYSAGVCLLLVLRTFLLHPVVATGFQSVLNPRYSDVRSLAVDEAPVTNASQQVNVTIVPTVNGQLILYEDDDPVNVTVVIRRSVGVGPLLVYLSLTSVSAVGDPSTAPSIISVGGLPLIVNESDAMAGDNVSDYVNVVEFKVVVQLSGLRLGRALLIITAQQQQPTDDELTAIGADPPSTFSVGICRFF
jgi:hypothetical protein